jgi:hypothetical protein
MTYAFGRAMKAVDNTRCKDADYKRENRKAT